MLILLKSLNEIALDQLRSLYLDVNFMFKTQHFIYASNKISLFFLMLILKYADSIKDQESNTMISLNNLCNLHNLFKF